MTMFYEFKIYKYLGNSIYYILKKKKILISIKIKGFPINGDLENYNLVYKNSFEQKPEPMTLLNALIKNQDDVNNRHY